MNSTIFHISSPLLCPSVQWGSCIDTHSYWGVLAQYSIRLGSYEQKTDF
jgi:hypothetical protein